MDPSKKDHQLPPTKLERSFERLLWSSRFLVLLAVVPSLLGAFVLFLIGTADIIGVAVSAVNYYFLNSGEDIHDTVVPNIIIAVDIYLIAVVLLIFGTGIYRLFVSPIDHAEVHAPVHPFIVESFDQLKDKIARVVLLAVIIEFFRAVVDIRFQTSLDAIYLAVSILALAGGLYLMSRAHKH
ncbi:YqhA family protein [Salinimonas chungwhensis]|uniref:YqhA family protein n=1 Tax=Salinimonas chungwhensis TaxID=265425 RepID=UPI00037CF615|nr:YqhA family protein [Salinimonas chungwhensis]